MMQRALWGLGGVTLSLVVIAATVWLIVWFESGLSG